MSARARILARLSGATEAELHRLRRLYAGDRLTVKLIDERLNPEPANRAARRITNE